MKKQPTRRNFLKTAVLGSMATGALTSIPSILSAKGSQPMEFAQTPLPYAYNALEPMIDAATMEIHYTKHAAAYTKNLNDAAAVECKDKSMDLELAFSNISAYSAKLRNNGGGHYNHELFWKCMQASREKLHEGSLKQAIVSSFGSEENFKVKLTTTAMACFGSGWAWLYLDASNTLQVGSTPNQDNPLMDVSPIKGKPLLGVDVWEHAYYLKYQNRRADYLNNWYTLVNWKFVESRFVRSGR